METRIRRGKRSFTEKQWDVGNAKPGYQAKINRYSTILNSISEIPTKTKVPVYTPGPKPSPLLLKYINKKTPPKFSIVSEMRKSLHKHSSSHHLIFLNNSKKNL